MPTAAGRRSSSRRPPGRRFRRGEISRRPSGRNWVRPRDRRVARPSPRESRLELVLLAPRGPRLSVGARHGPRPLRRPDCSPPRYRDRDRELRTGERNRCASGGHGAGHSSGWGGGRAVARFFVFTQAPPPACTSAGLVSVAAASNGDNGNGPAAIAAGPAFGYVPTHNPNSELAPGQVPSPNARPPKPNGRVSLFQYHGGSVRSSGTDVYPIYWGTAWSKSPYSDTAAGLKTFYQGVGGTLYAKSNTEYTDSTGSTRAPA